MAVKAKSQEQLFSQAEQMWDLKRLYEGLATVKGKSLTPMEKLHLRGLLCGHGPAEIAKKLHKNLNGVESDLCNTVYHYVKSLLNKEHQKVENWRNISEWLEQAGYQTKPFSSLQHSTDVTLPVEALDGLVKIINNTNNSFTIEIHVRLVASLPYDSLKKMVPHSEEERE